MSRFKRDLREAGDYTRLRFRRREFLTQIEDIQAAWNRQGAVKKGYEWFTVEDEKIMRYQPIVEAQKNKGKQAE
jgi:hypothetical protein